MSEKYTLKELKKGLIAWYDFRKNSSVLYIGSEDNAIAGHLRWLSAKSDDSEEWVDQGLEVVVTSPELAYNNSICDSYASYFDYIICIGIVETAKNLKGFICDLHKVAKDDCIFLFGINNRMGIRYFCGDRDPYTDKSFDGIENYRAYKPQSDSLSGRMYDKAEIRTVLNACGVKKTKFYSVLSDLDNPVLMFAEGYTPKEDITTRLYPTYNYPNSVFLDEEVIYKSLVDNDMFHQMVNAYLVEFTFDEKMELSDALQITSSMVRSAADSMITIIHSDNTVEKRNVYPEGRKRLENMVKYSADLEANGIKVVPLELTDRGLRMPYIDAPVGQLYLKNLFMSDLDAFFKAMDHFRDLILKSSEVVGDAKDDENGVTLKYGYVDLVPLNSFYVDGDFVFFDQEFREESYPANAIIARMVSTFYAGNFALQNIMTRDQMYARYNLMPRIGEWRKYESDFLTELRNDGDLKDYYKRVRKNGAVVSANRQRINFSTDDYYRLFVNIFDKADSRKLILFGSGKYAKSFMEMYSDNYPVYAIIDNDETKWGEELCSIKIHSPEFFKELSSGEYKVMICIKNYLPIIRQLDGMGVSEYSIYDANKSYPRKNKPIVDSVPTDNGAEPKKYHVGYIAGVFDLFHVGHLNMFKRAKEQCDYLIVGVVTDEGALKHNHKKTFVPFEERIEMVRSCRYVDEAVKIPVDQNDTKDAFAMYHFDVQFSGSDYINNQRWLDKQKFLRENGAGLVFFSYTQSTCSTNLKALIEKGLAE